MKNEDFLAGMQFLCMPEDNVVDYLKSRGHQVFDFRKDPTSPAKYIIQLSSEHDYIDRADLLAISTLGTITFYYSPARHFFIEKRSWRPYNSEEARGEYKP